MSHYIYQCFSCKTEFSVNQIEQPLSYLCPLCGIAETKRPLTGVLSIKYDYQSLKKKITANKFKTIPPGKPWLYPYLWPLHCSNGRDIDDISQNQLNLLELPANLISKFEFEKNALFVFDDTRNPTFSYKDRASILVALKAIQMSRLDISTASTGNAGSSLAGICARLKLNSHIFVPDTIPDNKRLQIQAYNANLHMVKGDYDTTFDLCLQISQHKGWFNRNTAYNPLTIEGKKSAAFDLFLHFGKNLPNYILVPVGDGVIIAGIYKGFWELQQLGWIETMPVLIAVQSEGSDALVRYLQTKNFTYQPAQTVADSICAGAPRNLYMAANSIQESGGQALSISDREILKAQKTIASQFGMLVEPAAAAGFAGYIKFREYYEMETGKGILLLFTGHGLKDHQSMQRWIEKSKSNTPQQWKNYYGIPPK